MADTTTTSVSEMVGSETIHEIIQIASKDATTAWRFANDIDLTQPGAPPTARLTRADSDVSSQSEIDALDQSEGSDISDTEFTTSQTSFGVSEFGIAREVTDDAVEDGILGDGLIQFLVNDGAQDLGIGFDDDVTDLLSGFTTTVGTSDSDLTLDNMVEATAELDDKNMHEGGGAVFILGSQQRADLLSAAQSGTGTILASFINLAGSEMDMPANFVGEYLRYPIWSSTLVTTVNTDTDEAGALIIRGDEGRNPRSAALATSVKRLPRPEMERDSYARTTKVVVTMRRGSAENIDDSGIGIQTGKD